MFKSPYDTTTAKAYNVLELEHSVEQARVEGGLVSGLVDGAPNVYCILETGLVDTYPHPLTFQSRLKNDLITVIDLTPFRSQIRRQSDSKLELPSSGPIPLALMRGRLQQLWSTPSSPDLYGISILPHAVFAAWVGDNVSRVLSLDAEASVAVTAVAGLWYWCQFQDYTAGETFSDRDFVQICTAIEKATRVPLARLMDYLTHWNKPINNATDFVAAVKACSNSLRTERLSVGSFYTSMVGGWFGSLDTREVVGVALEFPPTFIAMVWSSINERTYRKTPIGEKVLYLGKNGLDREFINSLGKTLNRAGG